MHNMSRQIKIVVVSLIAILILGAFFLWPKHQNEKKVLAAEAVNDPNHPTEVYLASDEFKTLDAMITDLKVQVYPEDKVTAFPPPDMGLGSRITIVRATPVEVTDAKVKKTYRTWAKTIGELLTEQKIELIAQDTVDPTASIPISSDLKIKITRIAEFDLTQNEDIDFPIIKKNNHDMERGQSTVEVSGAKGQKEVTYHIKRVDGTETSRKVTNTNILTQPVTEILIVGTGPKLVHSDPFMDLLNAAAKKYDVNATALQCLMLCESNGHTDSQAAAGYIGLFQYDPGFWGPASMAAGFTNALWTDAKAQIFTTARLISIGQSRRWPPFAKGCPRTGYTSCANK